MFKDDATIAGLHELTGKQSVKFNDDDLCAAVKGKVVMITGAGGSIGSELSKQIRTLIPKELILVERNETALFDISNHCPGASAELADVMYDSTKIIRKYLPHIIIHAAAYKHVPMLELHPDKALENNFVATHKMVSASASNGVERFVFISTDKAVEPISAMGRSKKLAEESVAGYSGEYEYTIVRFGNVLGSRGSVLETWERQIGMGENLTVTAPSMQRYFMTVRDACGLVLCASGLEGSGTYTLDMGDPVCVMDLAKEYIRSRGVSCKIDITGVRPGEKMIEVLHSKDEYLEATAIPGVNRVMNKVRESVV